MTAPDTASFFLHTSFHRLQYADTTADTAYCQDQNPDNLPTSNEIAELQTSYNNMLSAIIDLLDGAKYLWEGDAHNEQ